MIGLAILPALPRIIRTIGTLLIPGAILLTIGGTLMGYVLASGRLSGKRETYALETGQRNLAAALLVAAGSYGSDTFIMMMIGAVTLTIAMHIIAAGWVGRKAPGSPSVPVESKNPSESKGFFCRLVSCRNHIAFRWPQF